jgi:hypothetical protein
MMSKDTTLRLDPYQRDNLLAALVAIGNLKGAPNLNTGDWVCQVAFKLGWEGDRTDWGSPNLSAEQMAARHNSTGLRAAAGVLRDATKQLRRLAEVAPGENDDGIEEAAAYLDDLATFRERQAAAAAVREGGAQ